MKLNCRADRGWVRELEGRLELRTAGILDAAAETAQQARVIEEQARLIAEQAQQIEQQAEELSSIRPKLKELEADIGRLEEAIRIRDNPFTSRCDSGIGQAVEGEQEEEGEVGLVVNKSGEGESSTEDEDVLELSFKPGDFDLN